MGDHPPLFLCGRSAHASAHPTYTNGRVRFDGDARAYGFVGVASRHGQHTAVVVIEHERSCVTILVRVVDSFHPFEVDLAVRTPRSVEPTFRSDERRELFFDTLDELASERLCCGDAASVSILPPVCFASVAPAACLQCLVQLEDARACVGASTRAWFRALLDGVPPGRTGISRALEHANRPPYARVVFQRAPGPTAGQGGDDGAHACASVDAIEYVFRDAYAAAAAADDADDADADAADAADADAAASAAAAAAADDDDSGVHAKDSAHAHASRQLCRPMAPMERLRPESTASARVATASSLGSFAQRVGSIVLSTECELRLLGLWASAPAASEGTDDARGAILHTLALFDPPIAVLHRCRHSHRLTLHRHNAPSRPVASCEASRLVLRHGIVVAWDEPHDEVFRAVPPDTLSKRRLAVRLSDRAAHAALDAAEGRRRCASDASDRASDRASNRASNRASDRAPECAVPLKKLRASVG